MLELQQVTAFLGWCVVLHFIILAIVGLLLFTTGDAVVNIHQRLSNLDKQPVPRVVEIQPLFTQTFLFDVQV